MTGIGRLIDIAPRDAWSDEARDFTPWLADHLDGLGEVLGILLEYEDREVSVETTRPTSSRAIPPTTRRC